MRLADNGFYLKPLSVCKTFADNAGSIANLLADQGAVIIGLTLIAICTNPIYQIQHGSVIHY
jgi:hypothetical protein